MEEADVLCNRLAIMIQSAIRTSGSPEKLESLYGGGTVASISVDIASLGDDTREYADSIAKQLHPNATLLLEEPRSQSRLYKYVLPDNIPWSHLFHILGSADLLRDHTLARKSLEDVFVQLAKLHN